MTTQETPLYKEDPAGYQLLCDQCVGIFLDGECYAFAIALHRALGWQIVGLVTDDSVVRHALVRDFSGKLFDARGYVMSQEILAQPFNVDLPLSLPDIEEDVLFAQREITDFSIAQALRLAQAIWPDLGWKDSPSQRRKNFLSELHALSEKYGLRIVAPFPAALPILSERDAGDTIVEYALVPTATGGFLFR